MLHPLNNIEIINYFKYESRFNGGFSRNNLPIIKHGAYVINLDERNSKGTHWVSLLIDRNTDLYFYSFWFEYIPQEILKKIRDKSITHSVFRIQDIESIMRGFFFYCVHRIYDCKKKLS